MNKTQKLVLTWKPGPHRRKTAIGELVQNETKTFFRYIISKTDYESLKDKGFVLYYPFDNIEKVYDENVLDAFKSRLPDRRRSDFKKILSYWEINDLEISDFNLLKITGARLPTDGFELIDSLEDREPPFEFLFQIAGVCYYEIPENLILGSSLNLMPEPTNEFDKNAVKVLTTDNKLIGYIPSVQSKSVKYFIEKFNVKTIVKNKFENIKDKVIQAKIYVN